jgi:adenylosuccinate synthase
MKGWKTSTEGVPRFEALPRAAQDYLRFLEEQSGASIGMVSTGPDRDQTMVLPRFAEALDSMRS